MSKRVLSGVLFNVAIAAVMLSASQPSEQTRPVPIISSNVSPPSEITTRLGVQTIDVMDVCATEATPGKATSDDLCRKGDGKKGASGTTKTFKGFRSCSSRRPPAGSASTSWPVRGEPAIAICTP